MVEHAHFEGSKQHGHYGVAATGIMLAEATIAAAWNVQGPSSRASFLDEARELFGVVLPLTPNTIARSGSVNALWLAPASWLLIEGGTSALVDFAAKRDALNAVGGALFDVSDSRIAWRISGIHAATLLAKHCPLDFHVRAFPTGTCAQSLFGRVNALFVRAEDYSGFTLMVARSFAHDVWHALCESAAQYGYDVQPTTPYR
ncbi:MAG TPA: sarcosine oxidase subunit gamma family protein [Casimicrobiaceae bacterium]|nr:sarcosine oxidase subunit gamma family protein [Casimicrobiaceae bacterium]